ncbi:peptidase family M1 [Ancylostoma caninum]|uniref:Peptidase family M1 n=1 Tax=Ancylostoma caninum TaxID=29170 RepID=A0A368GZF7_ANCCA|nr:peptidase family M1 [Ancylostoma caninum]
MPPSAAASDAKRPLVLAAVLLCMIFILIYILITFPRPLITVVTVPPTTTTVTTTEPVGAEDENKKEATALDDDPYRFADQPFHRHHIPNIVRPSLYQVQLKLYLPWRPGVTFGALDFTLDGMTRMEFSVRQATRRIQLNIKHLNITAVRLYNGTEEIHVDEISEDFPQLLDIFSSTDLLPEHNYSLTLEFRAKINNPKYAGIFTAPYKHGSENRYKTATHLQPQEARSLFPCIDSPEAKARFEATIIHPEGTYALFNMKETNISTKGGWTTTTFLRSPIMSTYLFAMVVGTMPYRETYTARGVRIRIYAEAEKLNDTSLALSLTPRLLAFFEDYFQLPYPLEKLGRLV